MSGLDPQIADIIEALDSGFPPVHTMTGAQARAAIKARFRPAAHPQPMAAVEDATATGSSGDVAVRIYRPARSPPWCGPTAADGCSAISTAMTNSVETSRLVFLP